jgi:hypothetical protein
MFGKVRYDLIIDNYSLSKCGGCCGRIKGSFPLDEWTKIIPPKKHTKCRSIAIKPIDTENFTAIIFGEESDIEDYTLTCKWHHSKGENYCDITHQEKETKKQKQEREDSELPNPEAEDAILNLKYEINLTLEPPPATTETEKILRDLMKRTEKK